MDAEYGGIIFVSDVIVVMGDILKLDAEDMAALPENFRYNVIPRLTAVVGTLHPTGGLFMMPILLWGLVLIGPWSSKLRESRSRAG